MSKRPRVSTSQSPTPVGSENPALLTPEGSHRSPSPIMSQPDMVGEIPSSKRLRVSKSQSPTPVASENLSCRSRRPQLPRRTLDLLTQEGLGGSKGTSTTPQSVTGSRGSGGGRGSTGQGGYSKGTATTPQSVTGSGGSGGGRGPTGQGGYEDEEPEKKNCPCGAGICLVLTSITHPGRRYYRCPMQDIDGCNFFQWCADPFQGTADACINTCVNSDTSHATRCHGPFKRLPKDCLLDFFTSARELIWCTTLTEHIKDKDMFTNHMVPGARTVECRIYRSASLFAKMVIKAVGTLLSKLQEFGWSLNGNFDVSDFYVNAVGNWKISAEKFDSLLEATDARNTADFCQACKIIRDDVLQTEEQLPNEIEKYLDLLSSFKESNRYLIKHSVVLMSVSEQLDVFTRMHKKFLILEKTEPEKHAKIISEMPYCDPTILEGEDRHWKIRARQNNYLLYLLGYKTFAQQMTEMIKQRKSEQMDSQQNSSTQSQQPTEGEIEGKQPQQPVGTEITPWEHGLTDELDEEDLEYKKMLHVDEVPDVAGVLEENGEKDKVASYSDTGQGMLKLFRNCCEHLHPQHALVKLQVGKLKVSFEQQGGTVRAELSSSTGEVKWVELFTYKEIGYMLAHACPGFLFVFQKSMHEEGQLEENLPLEER
ncbi:hypothetical protein ACQJBY_027714 [Aegilops geniculata]